MGKTKVLFICTHNSARSQMAEAFLNHLGGERFRAWSAGTEPGHVHPLAVEVMAEIGLDITSQRAKSVDRFLGHPFNYVSTVCDRARESCPVFPHAARHLHWDLPDPSQAEGSHEERLATFRWVRDQVREHVRALIDGAFGPNQ